MSKKVLFITGGNGEIGRSIVNNFKEYIIFSPSSREMDCSEIVSIRNYIKRAGINKIDILIHCAGINNPKSIKDITEKSIEKTMKINTFSFLYIIQELSKYFVDNKTKVVAISSIYGSISRTGRLEYTTSKSALNGIVKSLALELAPRGIIINSISPGFIATKLTFKNNSKPIVDEIISKIPLGRLGMPGEIAWYVKMLCSSRNKYLTGQNLIIDGGYIIGGFQK